MKRGVNTYVLGLTGSIGCGKSTTARMFRRLGVPVSEADKIVHDLYRAPDFLKKLRTLFPSFFSSGVLDRRKLSEQAFQDQALLKHLEALIHPEVLKVHKTFIEEHRRHGSPLAVLDVPLLYETGMDGLCDGVLVVDCPASLARDRVMERPFMSSALFENIMSRQLDQDEKKKRADFILDTGRSRVHTFKSLLNLLEKECSFSGGQKHA